MSDINIVLENRDDIHVAVEEKDINVEVPAGKDGRALRPRGEWSASSAYAYLDLVSYEGSSYVATKAIPAGTLPTDTSYWMLSAEKGEPGGAVWGAITGDLSNQTDLADALLAKAPVILSSASGSIASFSDGSPAPVTALSVSIDPVQDLHGYDAPWPAGGGKNLLKPPSSGETKSGVTFTVNSDGTITANGTATSNADFYIIGTSGSGYGYIGISSGNYIVNGNDTFASSVASLYIIEVGGTTLAQVTSGNKNVSITIDDTKTYRVFIRISSGNTISNAVFKPMIRLASVSDATYAPYSNICPISGHTSAVVTRTGKNLCEGKITIATIATGGNILTNSSGDIHFGAVKAGKTYTATTDESVLVFAFYKNLPALNSQSYNGARSVITGKTFTAPIDGYVAFRSTPGFSQPQLELGSSASAYEPYQGTSVTIDLDGTRYGGTLNVLTGEMVVNRVMLDPNILLRGSANNTSDGRTFYITKASSNALGNGQHFMSNYLAPKIASTYEDLLPNEYRSNANNSSIVICTPDANTTKAQMLEWYAQNSIQFSYLLATPLTVQLTPSQMQTLLGENHIFADTGDTSVEYRADTKLYIDSRLSQMLALILEN